MKRRRPRWLWSRRPWWQNCRASRHSTYTAGEGEDFPIKLKNGISLAGSTPILLGPDATLVLGIRSEPVFEANQIKTHATTIEGFRIKGGRVGIACHDCPMLLIKCNHITQNRAADIECVSQGSAEPGTPRILENLITFSHHGIVSSGSAVPLVQNNIIKHNSEGLLLLSAGGGLPARPLRQPTLDGPWERPGWQTYEPVREKRVPLDKAQALPARGLMRNEGIEWGGRS